ncbi:hypothetical protein HanPSC8_Chr17g0780211 [Helianthus annuus]|nr:hypothetical protein HanPSC8_Chr17g0780211 [Helianthus annuus]
MSPHTLMSSRNINDQPVHRRFTYPFTTLKLSYIHKIHLMETHKYMNYKFCNVFQVIPK